MGSGKNCCIRRRQTARRKARQIVKNITHELTIFRARRYLTVQ